MKKFWQVQHWTPFEDNYHDYIRFIGIFSSKRKAMLVVKDLKGKPGFYDYPKNFYVGEVRIDQESWVDGFIN